MITLLKILAIWTAASFVFGALWAIAGWRRNRDLKGLEDPSREATHPAARLGAPAQRRHLV